MLFEKNIFADKIFYHVYPLGLGNNQNFKNFCQTAHEKDFAIVAEPPKAGSNSITMYLHQAGIKINHKKVERIYRENKLQLKNLTVIEKIIM